MHHQVIIAGSGISGLCALIQLKRILNVTDVKVYETGEELGGTWATNVYPGAKCDIPVALYSFSFCPAKEFDSQWPGSKELLSYYKRVVSTYDVESRVQYQQLVSNVKFSRSTGVWTITILDLTTQEERVETCNVFVSAVGALSTPADPPFDTTNFDGKVMHTAGWDENYDLKGKKVVVLGNGCSAAQVVPAIIDQVESITQIARSPHAIVPPPLIPDNAFTNTLIRYVPFLFPLVRHFVFSLCESYFPLNDTVKGKNGRDEIKKLSDRYIERTAPEKYWPLLKYDFEFGQKRRIIDFPGYTSTLHSPKVTLLQPDTIESAKAETVKTKNGVEIENVDLVILSTGFKVTDYLFPLQIENNKGEKLVERLKLNGVKTYLSSMISDYPNLWLLMGPNSVTGHSSVLYNTECTVNMMIELLKPVFSKLAHSTSDDDKPAPTVEVTAKAEDEWYGLMRAEMETKVWEADADLSWYVDEKIGKCTTLYPWGQLHFKSSTENIVRDRFIWSGC